MFSKSLYPFILVYDEVLIDKGDANDTIGPSELTGKIGNKFLVPRGRRAFINCNFAETGGFPYNESVNLPAAVEWFFNGVPLSASLYSQIHGNQLCFDTALFNFTGVDDTVQCKSTSRISEDGVMGQMDSETSNIMIVGESTVYALVCTKSLTKYISSSLNRGTCDQQKYSSRSCT